jgi:GT2 family glycosyltransferase
MDVSIIIPSFNTVKLTAACLRDLLDRPPRRSHEIIVVDNGSTDGTLEKIRSDFDNIRLIANPDNLGFAKACNLGAHESSGRYLCFLNSDTVNGGQAMDTLVEWLETHPQTGIAGPELRASDSQLGQMSWLLNPVLAGEIWGKFLSPNSIRNSPIKNYFVTLLHRASRPVPIITGASLMIRREAFEQINGFDENFELYFEDCDLCRRCRKAGWGIDFVKAAKVTHYVGQSSTGSWNLTSLVYQQSHIRYYRKHASTISVYLLRFFLLAKWLRLQYQARHEKDDSARTLAYCRAYRQVIREHRRITLAEGISRYLEQ